jgi:hypothetical protein
MEGKECPKSLRASRPIKRVLASQTANWDRIRKEILVEYF